MLAARPQPSNDVDDRSLVRFALSGRRSAIDTLVRRLTPVVRARVRRALGGRGQRLGPHDGDDLVQEVWLHLVGDDGKRLRAYDPERGMSLEGYVGIITEREVHGHRRKVGAIKRGGAMRCVGSGIDTAVASPDPSPEARVAQTDLAQRLAEHLEGELPERGRLVWRYVFTDERDPTDVAQLLGVKVQVIYNWQHKIRGLARSFVDAQQGDSALGQAPARPEG